VLVMGERGYPTEGYEQQVSDLSVEHASTIDRYRQAHDISAQAEAKKASTEDLRQAMVHYRTLFTELLDTGEDADAGRRETGDAVAEPETAPETASETGADEPVAEPVGKSETDESVAGKPVVDEPVVDEPLAEPAGTTERDATDAGTRDEIAGETPEAKTGTRTRSGRRTARRDSDDEGV
jgi:hypothetical protein